MLAARHSRILGVHLNDGYGKRDDGLIAGSVHPVQTVELFVALDRAGYDGVIYFDTFPDHGGTDPVGEARANIAVTDRLRRIAADLAGNEALARAQASQDAAAATRIALILQILPQCIGDHGGCRRNVCSHLGNTLPARNDGHHGRVAQRELECGIHQPHPMGRADI
eukprot:gene19010-23291_t